MFLWPEYIHMLQAGGSVVDHAVLVSEQFLLNHCSLGRGKTCIALIKISEGFPLKKRSQGWAKWKQKTMMGQCM